MGVVSLCSEDEGNKERPSKRRRTEVQSADTSRASRDAVPTVTEGGVGEGEVVATQVGEGDVAMKQNEGGHDSSRSSSATRIID
jgi:hypothetical protein